MDRGQTFSDSMNFFEYVIINLRILLGKVIVSYD